jgi:hypothetical protein
VTTQAHTYKEDEQLQLAPTNPFSPDYQSQIIPFKPTRFKVPELKQHNTYSLVDPQQANDKAKREKLRKAQI